LLYTAAKVTKIFRSGTIYFKQVFYKRLVKYP
jgi:hypothetical protein